MKKFIVEIELDNDAFNPLPHLEVARILKTVASKIDGDDFQDDAGFFLFDSCGNKVGSTKCKDDKACCDDCGDHGTLRRWKYDPEVKLCENCHEARALE